MKNLATLFIALFCITFFHAQTAQELDKSRIVLPNGWSLSPVGKQLKLGDLPLNLVASHNQKLLAVTNNGQSKQSIQIIDAEKGEVKDSIEIAKSWYGLAFSENDGFLYVSGGHDNAINKYEISNGLKLVDKYELGKPWPERIMPSGIALDEKHKKLFTVTYYDNSLYVFDLISKKVLQKISLGDEAYSCVLSPDKKKLYITVWGAKKVVVFDIKNSKIVNEIEVGNHPNEILLDKKGKFLYVANSEDNSVSVIEISKNRVVQTLNAALFPNSPTGSTTNGLALSENGKMLYIANADNNCLAVFDVSNPYECFSKGFIPVGWYPTNLKVVGNKIYVTNGKGLTSLANPNGPNPAKKDGEGVRKGAEKIEEQYIGGLFKGTLSIIPEPDEKQLAFFSEAVYKNSPYSKNLELSPSHQQGNPIPAKVGDKSPIKYVFYIIKENRTYDQVLGDIKKGNGDASLCLFGETVTPNQHALAENFVLLDNFYVNAEVSADGHNWSMGAYANDFVEKTWPTSYGDRGGDYPAEGEMKMGVNRDGFIWDFAKRANVSFRTYGEFTKDKKPNIDVLQGNFADYPSFDLGVEDVTRFELWEKDFENLLKIGKVPQLSTIQFCNDHTEGMNGGSRTPFAFVADNDLAVGKFVDYISHSSIWKESAIFILEDDAQNGPDHVDAHRSTAYVISPYVKRNFVDHTLYSTTSMLRTMELILGMKPMSQYDAGATPMWNCFTNEPNFAPYMFKDAKTDLNARNPKDTPLAKFSEKFNWKKEDAIPDLVFNDILWKGITGKEAPSPTRSAFLKTNPDKDDD